MRQCRRTTLLLALAALAASVSPAAAQGAPAAPSPLSPLDAYAEAAATTIIAEQNCPGVHLFAGRLTSLRLAAKVAPAQEAALVEKLKARATALRQSLATDGQTAWCAAAFAAFGPDGTIARGVLYR
jgi:hypothetical protein